MDLKSFGRRDIFGFLLPGMIPVLIGTYTLCTVLTLFQLSFPDILKQEFLVTVILLVSAYLVGSLLRLYSADRVDDRSGEHRLKVWQRANQENIPSNYESEFRETMAKFAKGDDAQAPTNFDDWLWLADEFPYVAWQNRLWRTHGFKEVLDFYQHREYRAKMWSQSKAAPKNFFNYCKLAVIDGGGPLANEVNTAEGLTRFFAGAFTGLRLSIGLLVMSMGVQVLVAVGAVLAANMNITTTLAIDYETQSVYFASSLVLVLALLWMCRQIVKRFRNIRQREVETVFYAFYIYVTKPYRPCTEKTA